MSSCKHQKSAFLFLAFLFSYLGSLEVLADDHDPLTIKKEIYPDGSYALIEIRDGIATGTTKEFDKHDSLLAEYELTDGELNGTFLTYNPDGTLKSSEKYAQGQRHGLAKLYDDRGYLQQVQRYEDGEFKELAPIHEAFEVFDYLDSATVQHCVSEEERHGVLLGDYWLIGLEESGMPKWYVFSAVADRFIIDETQYDARNLGFRSDSILINTSDSSSHLAHRTTHETSTSFDVAEIVHPSTFTGYACVVGTKAFGCVTRAVRLDYTREVKEIIRDEGDISVIPWIEKTTGSPTRWYGYDSNESLLYAARTVYTRTREITFNSSYIKETVLEYETIVKPRHVFFQSTSKCNPSTLDEMKVALQSDSTES